MEVLEQLEFGAFSITVKSCYLGVLVMCAASEAHGFLLWLEKIPAILNCAYSFVQSAVLQAKFVKPRMGAIKENVCP